MGELEADSQQLAVVSKKDSRQDGASCCLLCLRKVLPHPRYTFPPLIIFYKPFFIFILVHIVLSLSCTLIFSLVHTFTFDLDQHSCVLNQHFLILQLKIHIFLLLESLIIPVSFRTFGLDNFSVHHHACLSRWVNFHKVYLKQYSRQVYFMMRYFLLTLMNILMLEITRRILSSCLHAWSKHN